MKNFILAVLMIWPLAIGFAQPPSATPASSSDVEALREQVQSLTETVKTLQQQVQQQQATIEQMKQENAPEQPEPSPIAGAAVSPAPAASPAGTAATQFPTEDTSVVSTTAGPAGAPAASPPGGFPTTDTSVVTTSETPTMTTAPPSLTAPITIGGGRNYMNISFDGLFALAYSSARDLDHIEVGDHDPQQRGFNARNIELAFDGAVDPYFEGFANIVFKLDNDN